MKKGGERGGLLVGVEENKWYHFLVVFLMFTYVSLTSSSCVVSSRIFSQVAVKFQ